MRLKDKYAQQNDDLYVEDGTVDSIDSPARESVSVRVWGRLEFQFKLGLESELKKAEGCWVDSNTEWIG